MKKVVDYLKNNPNQYLATIGLDGKPKIRPFQFMFEENGKLYFCTSNNKEVYRELHMQPYIELCVSGENSSWLRLQAKVNFSESLSAKERIMELSPLVKSIYKSPDNPLLEVFYLSEAIATIADLSANTPQIFHLQ